MMKKGTWRKICEALPEELLLRVMEDIETDPDFHRAGPRADELRWKLEIASDVYAKRFGREEE